MAGATAVPNGATKIDASFEEIIRYAADAVGSTLALRTELTGSKTSIVAISDATITYGATDTGTATFGFKVSQLTVTLAATYNASATAGCKLDLEGSPDGTNFDDSSDYLTTDLTPSFTAGATIQKTWVLDPGLAALGAIKAIVTNSDGTYSLTGVTVTFNWVP